MSPIPTPTTTASAAAPSVVPLTFSPIVTVALIGLTLSILLLLYAIARAFTYWLESNSEEELEDVEAQVARACPEIIGPTVPDASLQTKTEYRAKEVSRFPGIPLYDEYGTVVNGPRTPDMRPLPQCPRPTSVVGHSPVMKQVNARTPPSDTRLGSNNLLFYRSSIPPRAPVFLPRVAPDMTYWSNLGDSVVGAHPDALPIEGRLSAADMLKYHRDSFYSSKNLGFGQAPRMEVTVINPGSDEVAMNPIVPVIEMCGRSSSPAVPPIKMSGRYLAPTIPVVERPGRNLTPCVAVVEMPERNFTPSTAVVEMPGQSLTPSNTVVEMPGRALKHSVAVVEMHGRTVTPSVAVIETPGRTPIPRVAVVEDPGHTLTPIRPAWNSGRPDRSRVSHKGDVRVPRRHGKENDAGKVHRPVAVRI